MSQDTENKQCQICHGYLFEDDDVVVCPECGAPHHRDCWNTVGHCGAEELHGTDRQYGKQPSNSSQNTDSGSDDLYQRVCPGCGRASKAEGVFCPYCGRPFDGSRPRNEYNSEEPHTHGPDVFFNTVRPDPDSYGGIPKSSEIEGIKVEHVAKFVGSNAHRYIPRFAVMKQSNRHSWNWAAFLFPSVWCFARKMYTTGIMYFILLLAGSLCFVPFTEVMGRFITEEMATQNYYDYFNAMIGIIKENYTAFGWPAFALAGIGTALNIVPRIICGKTADWVYRGFTLGKVKAILNDPEVEDTEEELMRSGSVNLLAMMLVFFAQQQLPSIIGSLIW